MWLAEEAIKVGVPVHAYIPFKGQGSNWPNDTRKRYESILKKSDVIKYISDSYTKDVFLKRDRQMVDNSNMVFSLLNPLVDSGGTYYTVKYAMEKGLNIYNYWRDE